MKPIEAIPHIPEADSFQFRVSLGNLWHAVKARAWVVVAITVITTALVAGYIWIWPATYEAEVLIAGDSDKDVQRSTFYQGWAVFRREGLADEVALMTSAPVLEEVVRKLDLKYEDVYHPFMSYLTYLWGESWVGKTYRKVKYWIFPKKPVPFEPTPEEIERAKVVQDFRSGVNVQQLKDASVGLLVVRASNYRVAEIANTVADVYLQMRRDRQIREAQEAYDSLAAETAKTERELEELDREIRAFRSENGLLLQFEKDRLQIGQWQTHRAAIAELEAQIADNESELRIIRQQFASESELIGSDRVFRDAATQDRLVKLEAQLAQTKQLFQAGSPEVRELEEQIKIALASVDRAKQPAAVRNASRVGESYELLRAKAMGIESKLSGARAALKVKVAEQERMRSLLERLPEKMKLNQEYERRQVVLESKYRTLNDKLSIATVSLATARSAPAALRVVHHATAPEQPVWPKTKLFMLAAVSSGLLLGVIAALLLELVFVRVSRHRLWERDADYRVFAIVEQDEAFLERLYPRQDGPKLLAAPASS